MNYESISQKLPNYKKYSFELMITTSVNVTKMGLISDKVGVNTLTGDAIIDCRMISLPIFVIV